MILAAVCLVLAGWAYDDGGTAGAVSGTALCVAAFLCVIRAALIWQDRGR